MRRQNGCHYGVLRAGLERGGLKKGLIIAAVLGSGGGTQATWAATSATKGGGGFSEIGYHA